MVKIPGKYQLVENKNFYEFLVGLGVPEAKAKEDNQYKGTVEISVDGDKVTIIMNSLSQHILNLVVGQAVEETTRDGVLLTTTKLEGNVLTMTSKTKDGQPALLRSMTFSDNGVEAVMTLTKDGKTYTTTRIYKRT